jgi:hypothetical protein
MREPIPLTVSCVVAFFCSHGRTMVNRWFAHSRDVVSSGSTPVSSPAVPWEGSEAADNTELWSRVTSEPRYGLSEPSASTIAAPATRVELVTELPLWWRLQIAANSPFSGSKSQNPPIMTIIGIFRAFLIPIWLVMTTIGILKQFCFEEISYKFQFGPL